MREIEKLIVHCSDTPASMDIGEAEIRQWHVEERGWSDIGYHFVIRRDGTVEVGRPLEKAGAHTHGHNKNSIGVCLVGGGGGWFNFTMAQLCALRNLHETLALSFEGIEVRGHREFNLSKACPCFDVQALLQ